jgi:hypothetical protein
MLIKTLSESVVGAGRDECWHSFGYFYGSAQDKTVTLAIVSIVSGEAIASAWRDGIKRLRASGSGSEQSRVYIARRNGLKRKIS